jgi:glycosyltransferase involved in cell wall biosynthesis
MIAKTGTSENQPASPPPAKLFDDAGVAYVTARRKKLLFVVNVDWFFMSHRLPIALEAMRQGYEVHLATGMTDRREALAALGLQVHELPLLRSGASVLGELRTLRRMAAVMREVRPDIVHLVTVKPVVLGGIAARLARVPAVVSAVSGLGFVFTARGIKAKLLRTIVVALYRAVLGHPNMKVIFQNDDDRLLLQSLTGLEDAQSMIIRGSGVDLDRFAVRPFPAEPVVVLFAARLLRDKGVEEFVQAARMLRRRGVNAVFCLAGAPDPANRASVGNEELRDWRSSGCVEFLGHLDDMAQVLADAHIVVLPSYREGLPKVLAEAAACGRPVITTDVPGCRDAIVPGQTGLLVPAKDAKALAAAIERLIADPEMRLAMGGAGRRLAEREYAVGHIVEQHLSLYRQLLGAT